MEIIFVIWIIVQVAYAVSPAQLHELEQNIYIQSL